MRYTFKSVGASDAGGAPVNYHVDSVIPSMLSDGKLTSTDPRAERGRERDHA